MQVWYSYHVFTEENLNEVLIKQVNPFVRLLKSKALINRFFYIRYGEGGPHLRLRFQTSTKNEDELNELLQQQFKSNNFKVVKETYHAEIARYGGLEVLPIAEDYFQLSSETCLAILQENTEDKLTKAIILHFTMAKASGKPPYDLIHFFDLYTKNWFAYSGLMDDKSSIKHLAKTHFEASYVGMKESIFFQNLSTKLASDKSTEIPWLDQWYEENKKLLTKIDSLLDDEAFFSVLDSLMHMTNNRLGIENYNESFLSYLLKRILEDLLVHE